MCGIAGVVRLEGRIGESDRVAVARMLRAEAHRGPDGEDCFLDDVAVLGHLRLAIIDLSERGRQPMSNETGDVWISANAEIYNFRELRSELEACGHHFESQTDVEVLLHGYEEWGIEFLLSRLRGMYAFALYDARREGSPKLFLVRDRFGIKPLYYAARGSELVFASELTALAASGLVEPELDDNAVVSFLELGSIPGPATALKGVATVPAGHYVEIDRGGSSARRYWKLGPGAEGEDGVAGRLAEAVNLHLVSDVPVGVFLSGGIDSATLVALASTSMDTPLRTLSVVFDDRGLNEARYARRVAEHYRTDHREIFLGADEFLETLPAVFDAMDSPTVDGVNTYFVSRAAKRADLKVVLTGLGGDEVFLGYSHYRMLSRLAPLARVLARLPRSARAGVAALLKAIAGRDKLDYLEAPSAGNLYRMFRGLYTPRQIAELVDGSARELDAGDASFAETIDESDGSLLDAAVRLEFEHYLQNQLLRDTDAMSMAHSIEARVPFLDHRLVETVYGLPHASKLARGVNKPLLLKALPEPLPREVWDRPKQGFTLPFRRFMLAHRDELQARTRESKLYRAGAVDQIWSEFGRGRTHWSRPWALVALAAWSDRLRSIAAMSRREPMLETARPR